MPHPRTKEPSGPARFMRHPQQFGHTDPGVFREAVKGEEHEREAAMVQHRFARLVRNQVSRLDLDVPTIAEQVGITPDHFYRLLRGESALRIAVMLRMAEAVGIDLRITFKPGQ